MLDAIHAELRRAADLTGHDLPQGNTDMGEERQRHRPAEIGRKGRHRPLNSIGRGNGAQRIVLMRHRSAEHRHRRIANVLVDRAAMLDDQRVRPREETVDDTAYFLGAELARKLRKAAEIGEQHRYAPTLRLLRAGWSRVLQARDGLQQPLAMAERGDTELAQVVGRKPAQQPVIDVIGDEGIRVLAEAQSFKPATNVHFARSDSGPS